MSVLDSVRRVFFSHHCEGPVIGEGFVVPTNKCNKPPAIIRGYRRVRLCNGCEELFSRPDPFDLIDAAATPAHDVTQSTGLIFEDNRAPMRSGNSAA